ncbi:hypothetical protein C446_02377 [Halobiforma nitratireducens JCM 10879]|uniref:Uncharacterized protein n=1 Tax=Halobiforma nitratireducens JCM 10879 TaxID=1227454 RepID=M0MIS7_9EURY|nr:hypothetical protein C446_02377 [Halobiforma nitratireducens JCM 10879]
MPVLALMQVLEPVQVQVQVLVQAQELAPETARDPQNSTFDVDVRSDAFASSSIGPRPTKA